MSVKVVTVTLSSAGMTTVEWADATYAVRITQNRVNTRAIAATWGGGVD